MDPTPAEQTFPTDFLWGVATAAHQIEGGNDASDWSDWERLPDPPSRLTEPCGVACDSWNRYREDVALIAELGMNAYRFSVEWARIEPAEGEVDDAALDRYADLVAACHENGIAPVVTLQHFTLPRWVAALGGWTSPRMPELFARYAERVAARLGDPVRYFCTINEPGNMLTSGYLGAFPAPPFREDLAEFDRAVDGLNAAHRLARDAVRQARPDARVGMAHALQEWTANPGGRPVMEWVRTLFEDRFFAETAGDDFIGVQTYTRVGIDLPRVAAGPLRLLLRSRRLTQALVLPPLRRMASDIESAAGVVVADGARRTQMGYAWAPDAVASTTRRVAALFPGKELLITEHGIGTEDDAERIEFLEEGLRSVRGLLADGLPVRGYFHWSLLDNWEWREGYRPKFGLVAVDRQTQERTVKPSARWYGAVARTGKLPGGA